MQRLSLNAPQALFDSAATRRIEQQAAAALPAYTLMQRAGRAIARLASALAPHARCYWVVCGAGNNGGDGLEAALLLHSAGRPVLVSCLASDAQALPADARQSWGRAHNAGVRFVAEPPPLGAQDLVIDALLGLGLTADARQCAPDARLLHWLHLLRSSPAALLSVDLPSGLLADTGCWAAGLAPQWDNPEQVRHTLSLLTLKPGLLTAQGRDAAGQLWLDDLGVDSSQRQPSAWLAAPAPLPMRAHASHKGSFGDVAVLGGQGLAQGGMGMTGAALLAASAALHAGAGRVFVSLLDGGACQHLETLAELMLRSFAALPLETATVVCGCGGGQALTPLLPQVLRRVPRLVLDADALNAIAADPSLAQAVRARSSQWAGAQGFCTVLTPHPLEAARLLGSSTQAVQSNRLLAVQSLADQYACVVLLKGSGTVLAAPSQGAQKAASTQWINPTGNARLATAGTGDVLAGLLGAVLAQMQPVDAQQTLAAALHACWQHGALADTWPAGQVLTASALARSFCPF